MSVERQSPSGRFTSRTYRAVFPVPEILAQDYYLIAGITAFQGFATPGDVVSVTWNEAPSTGAILFRGEITSEGLVNVIVANYSTGVAGDLDMDLTIGVTKGNPPPLAP